MLHTLKDICIQAITKRYSLFKEQLNLIPTELQENVVQELPENKMQCINGKWYPKEVNSPLSDWGNYSL